MESTSQACHTFAFSLSLPLLENHIYFLGSQAPAYKSEWPCWDWSIGQEGQPQPGMQCLYWIGDTFKHSILYSWSNTRYRESQHKRVTRTTSWEEQWKQNMLLLDHMMSWFVGLRTSNHNYNPITKTVLWHSNEVPIHHKPHFYTGWMLDRRLAPGRTVQSKSHVCIILEIVVCHPTCLHGHSSLLVVYVPEIESMECKSSTSI